MVHPVRVTYLDAMGCVREEIMLEHTTFDMETRIQERMANQNSVLMRAKLVHIVPKSLLGRLYSTLFPRAAKESVQPSQKIMMHASHFLLKLGALLEANVSLLEALHALGTPPSKRASKFFASHTQEYTFCTLSQVIMARLKEGSAFSDILHDYPEIFPRHVVAMIHLGMHAGTLGKHVIQAARTLSDRVEHISSFKKSITYPLTLLCFMFILFLGFARYLLPEVAVYLQDMGAKDLPLASRILLNAENFFTQHSIVCLLIGGMVLFALAAIKASIGVQRYVTRIFMHIPFIGEQYKRFLVLPWIRTLSEMYGAGAGLATSFEHARSVQKNPYVREQMHILEQRTLSGVPLTQAMAQSNLFSPFTLALCDVGVRTGDLAAHMDKAYTFEHSDMRKCMHALSQKVAPALLCVAGLFLLLIVMGVILPLYDLANVGL